MDRLDFGQRHGEQVRVEIVGHLAVALQRLGRERLGAVLAEKLLQEPRERAGNCRGRGGLQLEIPLRLDAAGGLGVLRFLLGRKAAFENLFPVGAGGTGGVEDVGPGCLYTFGCLPLPLADGHNRLYTQNPLV